LGSGKGVKNRDLIEEIHKHLQKHGRKLVSGDGGCVVVVVVVVVVIDDDDGDNNVDINNTTKTITSQHPCNTIAPCAARALPPSNRSPAGHGARQGAHWRQGLAEPLERRC
jgi:hypothetical protein